LLKLLSPQVPRKKRRRSGSYVVHFCVEPGTKAAEQAHEHGAALGGMARKLAREG
jgi:hypothetical protein